MASSEGPLLLAAHYKSHRLEFALGLVWCLILVYLFACALLVASVVSCFCRVRN